MVLISILHAVLYGIVQGLTEFLPVSSNAHLRLAQILLDPKVDNANFTAFTAVIQLGTIVAVLIFFRKELGDTVRGWAVSLTGKERGTVAAKTGWAVFVGTLPIIILGLVLKHRIEHTFRGLYFIGFSLIFMGVLMFIADRKGDQGRSDDSITVLDGVKVGLWQCFALIPGMSRSGSTITGGLFSGFNRLAAARFSFLLGVPGITLAGLKELMDHRKTIVGGELMTPTIIATVVSFFVGYAAIAYLMKFLQTKGITPFVLYRVVLGIVILGLVAGGVVGQNDGEPPEKSNTPATISSH